MKKQLVLNAIFASVLGLFSASTVFAHTSLVESVPADEAMLMQAPESLSLVFSEDVRLMKVTLTMGDQQVETGFKASSESSKQFSMALPKLERGGYRVSWTVMGADTHLVEGSLGFMVGMMADGEHGDHQTQQQGNHHDAHSGGGSAGQNH